jgi:hypothetical protein
MVDWNKFNQELRNVKIQEINLWYKYNKKRVFCRRTKLLVLSTTIDKKKTNRNFYIMLNC